MSLLLLDHAPLHLDVLEEARHQSRLQHYSAAVVTAQTAAEIRAAAALTELFQLRGVPELEAPVRHVLHNTNLGHEDVRRFYEALSGDVISTTFPRWSDFRMHARLRNSIVHEGARATRQEAEASISIVAALSGHVDAVLDARRTTF